MKCRFCLLSTCLLAFFCPANCCSASEHRQLYDVGVATVDVTPNYPIRLNGFGNRREESEGVSQRIYARAMAISAGEAPPLVLIALDSLGVRMTHVDEVAAQLQESHGLPRENLALTFSHSHCTPKVNGACDNIFSQAIPPEHQVHIDRYTRELVGHLVNAARQALDARTPGRMDWTVGKVTFAMNRRTAGGPFDHDLPLLVVREPDRDQVRAIYVSYACHATTLSFNLIHGDWVGYAAQMIQRRVPGATAFVSIGAGSDQKPASGVVVDKVEIAEGQGVQIANEVERLLGTQLRPIRGTPSAVLNSIDLPLNTLPTREQLQRQTTMGRPTDRYNAETQLARLDRGESLLSRINYPVQTWSFADSLCMVFLAGEVCVDYSVRLKTEMDRSRFWLNTYSNDFCSYIPSERLVREGGYGGGGEVPYFALPATLKPGLEQQIIDEVHRQVPLPFHAAPGTQGVPPRNPDDSLECLSTHPNLQVDLVAAEPHLSDPVAIDFGPDGRLWVAEMNDYGQGVYEKFKQHGRIRTLRDADGDGEFDQSEVFLDGLRFPTDVKIWRDGVLICDAPDILFARDTTGDGTADSVTTLFSGFEVRNAQARVNSLRFGLDNWVHGACGLFGGKITSHLTGATIDLTSRDFRCHPDTGVIEAVAGRTQQGRCRNDYGDWFGCSNGTLLRHYATNERYAGRNPFVAAAAPGGLKAHADAFRLYPPDDLVRFELSGVPGAATSACGLGILRTHSLGDEFYGDAFTCEPVHQCVHRIDLYRDGLEFVASRGANEAASEFLSSTDRWFRPVQARTGPDGALWVVDMYRYVIEHPRWIPQSTLAEVNVKAGHGMGRIYRVAARTTGKDDHVLIPRMDNLPLTELVHQLKADNGTLRDMAHQLLIWRNEPAAVGPLLQLAADDSQPLAQIHALAILQHFDALTETACLHALRSSENDVVIQALTLCDRGFGEWPMVREQLRILAKHSDPRVRRQVAWSLGESESPTTAALLAELCSRAEPDGYVRSAAMTSVNANTATEVWQHYEQLNTAAHVSGVSRQLASLAIRMGSPESASRVISSLVEKSSQFRQRPGLLAGLSAALNALNQSPNASRTVLTAATQQHLHTIFTTALTQLRNPGDNEELCLAFLHLLGTTQNSTVREMLNLSGGEPVEEQDMLNAISHVISAKYSLKLQLAAVDAMAATGAVTVPEMLIDRYPSVAAATRQSILDVLLGRDPWIKALLHAVRDHRISSVGLDVNRRSRLLNHPSPELKSLAARLLNDGSSSSRQQVLADYEPAILISGDAAQGQAAFRRNCSTCHRLQDHGFVVGPDLKALTNRDPRWLVTTILDPNREVDARYVAWTVATVEGRTFSGLLVEETTSHVTLREAGGKEHVILRSEIEELVSSERSLMPEGIERDMSPQDLSNILAYLSSQEVPPKVLEGNTPQPVSQSEASGIVSLPARLAEIRGGDITLESTFQNIGYWHHQNDTVTWQFNVTRPGAFDIYVDASCGNSGGNSMRIDGLMNEVVAPVSPTGGWDRFQHYRIGATELTAGTGAITLRSNGPISEALFDLREIQFVPAGRRPDFRAPATVESALPRYPPQIAPFLLDESQSVQRRQQVIDQRPGMGPAIIGLLAKDLRVADVSREYVHIPWIWRVAIAVGKRNDGGEIRDLLEISCPRDGQPLRHWQAVVIGGGIINGLSQIGAWPDERISEILTGAPEIAERWPRTLELSFEMADDISVKSGTRYDAIRMLALADHNRSLPHLLKFLAAGTDSELQMGAVSGLSDVRSSDSTQALIDALEHLTGRNRELAIQALARTNARKLTFLAATQP